MIIRDCILITDELSYNTEYCHHIDSQHVAVIMENHLHWAWALTLGVSLYMITLDVFLCT